MATKPSLVSSQRVDLSDGRYLRILEYDNRKVRIRINDSPYVIEEAFITGKAGQNSIIMLSPGPDYVPYKLVRQMVKNLAAGKEVGLETVEPQDGKEGVK